MSAFEPGLRRVAAADIDVGGEPELVARIGDEIRANGPMTFARFMQRALYEPALGYYAGSAARPGRQGDFLTAPETHPIFGRLVARQLDELWRLMGSADRFVVREYGAGAGTLAASVLDGLVAEGSGLAGAIRYQAVEIDPRRLEAFNRTLSDAGFAASLEGAADEAIVGVVLANEVLDALPVHRLVQRPGGLRELFVGLEDDRFVEVDGEPSTPALAARLETEGVALRDGQRAEVCLALDDWIAGAAAGLERGLLLIIDYGHPAAELYGPRRMAGTLAAYVHHRVHDDPLINVGRQDLTAHVDLTAVERAATAAGLASVGQTTQAEFLVGLGAGELLAAVQADAQTTIESYLALRAALGRLLDPSVSGAFRVLAFGRGLPPRPALRGFAFRLRGAAEPT